MVKSRSPGLSLLAAAPSAATSATTTPWAVAFQSTPSSNVRQTPIFAVTFANPRQSSAVTTRIGAVGRSHVRHNDGCHEIQGTEFGIQSNGREIDVKKWGDSKCLPFGPQAAGT